MLQRFAVNMRSAVYYAPGERIVEKGDLGTAEPFVTHMRYNRSTLISRAQCMRA